MKFIKLSWEQLQKDCITLAKNINANLDIDEIICISRGGLVVARILSDFLDVKISTITIESYQNIQQEKEPVITQFLPETYMNETILLVDEVSDTGKTLKRALTYLKTLPIKKIYTLTPYIKPHSQYIPDFWKIKTDKWIIFPYEIMETKKALHVNVEGRELITKLYKIGYADWEVQAVESD